MPELVDVEGFLRVARRAGRRRIGEVVVHDAGVLRGIGPRELARRVEGCRFGVATRHGKWLIVALAPGSARLLFHFGMTGSLHWCDTDSPGHRHDRVEFHTAGGVLRYRDMRKLTGLRLARDEVEQRRALGDLGPDALSVSRDQLAERLRGRRRQLKSALMDQTVVAGLGNLLADEILWQACIAPASSVADLGGGDLDRLDKARREVLRVGVRAGQVPARRSWLTGNRGRDGRCPRHDVSLRRGSVGGRTTFWCPRCQPA